MLMILLFIPSATPLVIRWRQKVRIFSRCRESNCPTRFIGSKPERSIHFIQRLKKPAGLPSLDVLDDRVGYRGNKRRRNLRPVHVHQMGLNLANGHAPGIKGQDLVIEARPAGLMLADKLGLEGAQAVTGNFNGEFTEIALEGFAALSVTGIAGIVCDGSML